MSRFEKIYKSLLPHNKYPVYLRKKGVSIGKGCDIYKSADFGSEPYLVSIGNNVRVSDGVKFITHDGGCWVLRNMTKEYGSKFVNADHFGEIVIHDNVHIGTNAIIMPGVRIGENSIVACGAVVTHDVLPNSVVGGVPAKMIETLEEYAEKAEKRMIQTKGLSQKAKKAILTK